MVFALKPTIPAELVCHRRSFPRRTTITGSIFGGRRKGTCGETIATMFASCACIPDNRTSGLLHTSGEWPPEQL
jgi:hypothetical protein